MEALHTRRARELVYGYAKGQLEKTDTHVTFLPDDVYVVWFTFTLGNWKCLCSTVLPDGMYYEVTYDVHKEQTYLDAYKKFDNVCIPDGMNFENKFNGFVRLGDQETDTTKVDAFATFADLTEDMVNK